MRILTYTVTLAIDDNRDTGVDICRKENKREFVVKSFSGGHLSTDLGRVIGQALIQSARAVLDKEEAGK